MKNIRIITPQITILIFVVILFWQLTKTFYQQDEWLALGNIISNKSNYFLLSSTNLLHLLLGEGRIASRLISYLFIGGFPFNIVPLSLFAILFHSINTLLVFHLANKFFKNLIFSLVAASFFAVNSVSHQAVTWYAAAIGTLPATTLILISIFTYIKAFGGYPFARIESVKRGWMIATVTLIYISLHFKEIGLFTLLFLPLTLFLGKDLFYRKIKLFFLTITPFLIVIFYKIMELKFRTTESNLYITGLNENFFSTILLRSILYPLTSFSLMFVPGDHFLLFARFVLRQIYPFFASADNNILIAQSVILDLLAVILTLFILILIYFLLQKEKPQNKKTVYFCLIFLFMSFSPYILLSKDFSYLEGRYYYLSVAGGAFLLSWVLKRLWEVFGQRIFSLIVLPILIFYLVFHASVIEGSITEQVRLADIRKDFIMQLKTLLPTLDNKRQIFYTSSDLNYWSDGNKIPFQQGSGYTYMVLYYQSGKIPSEFLKDGFLFDIASQGYRETRDYGFGYFWDKQELEKVVKQYNLPQGSIIKLEYNSKTHKLKRND